MVPGTPSLPTVWTSYVRFEEAVLPTILHDQPGPTLASCIPCNRQLKGFLLRTAIDRNGWKAAIRLGPGLKSRTASANAVHKLVIVSLGFQHFERKPG